MKIKLISIHTTLFSLLFALSSATLAEIKLEDNSKLIGSWFLESVAPTLDRKKIPENRVWEFREDGKMTSSGFNRIIGKETTQEMPYRIENGKIFSDVPGRPGKFDTYEVYEMKGDSMILKKGGKAGYYFFKKK